MDNQKQHKILIIFASLMLIGLGVYFLFPALNTGNINFFSTDVSYRPYDSVENYKINDDIKKIFGYAWASGMFLGGGVMLFLIRPERRKHGLEKTPKL